jgi:hypothetical protein
MRFEPAAAVIFGHNISWKKKWKNDGADDELEDLTSLYDTPTTVTHSPALASSSSSPSDLMASTPGTSTSNGASLTPPTSISTHAEGTTGQVTSAENRTSPRLPLVLETSSPKPTEDGDIPGGNRKTSRNILRAIQKRLHRSKH